MATDLNIVVNKHYKDSMSLRLKGDFKQIHSINITDINNNKYDFKFFTMDLSYFCGKLEMYFRYKEIPFERIEPHAKEFETILCKNTGSEQLPQVYDCRKETTDDCRWLRDTTYIIDHLEHDKSISGKSLSILPDCKVQLFFQKLFEDYADEYLWRPAMFWRWEPSFDRSVMGLRFTYEFARTTQFRYSLIPSCLLPYILSLRQWLLSSYGEGCDTEEKKQVIVDQYYELLEILEEILKDQPYLFGNRPTLIDFAFAGPFFRHFSSDFTPRKVMQNFAPNVYEWVARLWNCTSSKMRETQPNFPESGTLPKSWHKLLKLLPDYLEYYRLNALSYSKGDNFFKWINKGQEFTVPTVHYRVWCKKELAKEFNSYDAETKETIVNILKENCDFPNNTDYDKLFVNFDTNDVIVKPECGTQPPFSLPSSVTNSQLSYKWNANSIFIPYLIKKTIMISGGIGLVFGLVVGGKYFCHNLLQKYKININ